MSGADHSLESLEETLEILSDPALMRSIRRAERDMTAPRTPGLSCPSFPGAPIEVDVPELLLTTPMELTPAPNTLGP